MWPKLTYLEWSDTLDTLHLWMQVAGKVKLELAPFVNHWWEVAFYVSATGLSSGAIPFGRQVLQVDFDFLNHVCALQTSAGLRESIPLQPQSVAEFYRIFMRKLTSLGVTVSIWPVPVEVYGELIPFAEDVKHAAYDPRYVERWWHVLIEAAPILEQFRGSFRGKSSPIQFYWGSLDLNGARYSGKEVQPPQAQGTMRRVLEFAENEENYAFGFWPGDERFPESAFYSYMYPLPAGADTIKLTDGAYFHEQLGEFILPYDMFRTLKHHKRPYWIS